MRAWCATSGVSRTSTGCALQWRAAARARHSFSLSIYSSWTGDPSTFSGRSSLIEGIGRPHVEPSFLPDIVDRMIRVPDAASIATMRLVRKRKGRSVGGSTGTNVWGAFLLAAEMRSRGERGSVVTLICDGGDRYSSTYYSDAKIITKWNALTDEARRKIAPKASRKINPGSGGRADEPHFR